MATVSGETWSGEGEEAEHFLLRCGGFSTVFLAQRKRDPFSRGVEAWTKKRVGLGDESKASAAWSGQQLLSSVESFPCAACFLQPFGRWTDDGQT